MQSIIDEMIAAARGVFLLLVGNRDAARYFDFSQKGLIGSFIALLVSTAFSAYFPALFGYRDTGVSIARGVVISALLFALQIGFSAIVLRQMKRLEGLRPYIVADNWATFFITVLMTFATLLGLDGDFAIIVVGLVVLIVEINIARLIVTLSPLQIAMFLIAQVVGLSVGFIILGAIFPLPPEVQAELQSAMLS